MINDNFKNATILILSNFAEDTIRLIKYLSYRCSSFDLIIPIKDDSYKAFIERSLEDDKDFQTILSTFQQNSTSKSTSKSTNNFKLPNLFFVKLDIDNATSIKTFSSRIEELVIDKKLKNIDKIITYTDDTLDPDKLVGFDEDFFPMIEVNGKNIHRCMFTNLFATYYLCKSILDKFNVERVVVIGSLAHWEGSSINQPNKSVYAKSKLGLFYMTQMLSEAYNSTIFIITDDQNIDYKRLIRISFVERIVFFIVSLFVSWFGHDKNIDRKNHLWVPITYLLLTQRKPGLEYISCMKEVFLSRYISERFVTWFFPYNFLFELFLPKYLFINNKGPCRLINNHYLHDEYVGEILKIAEYIDKQ